MSVFDINLGRLINDKLVFQTDRCTHVKPVILIMAGIDMGCLSTLFGALRMVACEYWHLWSGFVPAVILVNIILFCGVRDSGGYLNAFWKYVTMIYVTILFIALFGIPMIAILDYIERVGNHQLNIDIAITVWLYIFWSAIVFKIMILPTYKIKH